MSAIRELWKSTGSLWTTEELHSAEESRLATEAVTRSPTSSGRRLPARAPCNTQIRIDIGHFGAASRKLMLAAHAPLSKTVRVRQGA